MNSKNLFQKQTNKTQRSGLYARMVSWWQSPGSIPRSDGAADLGEMLGHKPVRRDEVRWKKADSCRRETLRELLPSTKPAVGQLVDWCCPKQEKVSAEPLKT